METIVFGLNHRTAPLELREKVALVPEEIERALSLLREHQDIGEAAVLSTCNRTEFYLVTGGPEPAAEAARSLVKEFKRVELRPDTDTYLHTSRDCVEHLFRVAGGIDSMVIGEAAILGQVKVAYEAAAGADATGPVLDKMFRAALHVGKKSRTETRIGRGAVSLEKSAVQLAQKIFGDLERRTALVVGAGDTGSRTAALLKERGIGALRFANRTRERAERLAEEHGGSVIELAELESGVADVDVIATAVSVTQPILGSDFVERALASRRNRPLLVLDLGVPRNVAPDVGSFGSVFLYAVDDLQELVNQNLEKRSREIPHVERIVREEANHYFEWLTALDAAPVVVAIRKEADRVRRETIERFDRNLSPGERELLEKFSLGLMNKLMHSPTLSVRKCDANTPEGLRRLAWTKRLFGVDGKDGTADVVEDPRAELEDDAKEDRS